MDLQKLAHVKQENDVQHEHLIKEHAGGVITNSNELHNKTEFITTLYGSQ